MRSPRTSARQVTRPIPRLPPRRKRVAWKGSFGRSSPGASRSSCSTDRCSPTRRSGASKVAAGFVTGEQGVGHLGATSQQHCSDAIVLRAGLELPCLSDHIRCTLPGDFKVDVTFLHVNPRHHTVALGSGLPKHLHHFMLQMGSLDGRRRRARPCVRQQRARRTGARPSPERPDGDFLLCHALGLRMRSWLGRTDP